MTINAERLRIELRRARIPALLYAALVVCGLVTAWVLFKNQTIQWPWEKRYEVRAAFADAKGVVPGKQQVRLAGVPVGIISKVDLVDGRPVLTLSLDKRYAPLYRDARLRLRPVTPLQDMYVSIESRGTPSAGRLGAGEVITAEQTQTPVDISRVLNTFDADTRVRMHELLDGLGRGLHDHGAQLRAAFVQLAPFLRAAQRLSETVAERRTHTARLVSNLALLTGALGQRGQQLASLVHDGSETLGTLAGEDRSFGATLRELPRTLGTLRGSFSQLRGAEDELDPALRALDPVTAELPAGLRALERLGRDATPALAALRTPVRELRPLARSLAPASASLRTSFARLSPQAPRVDRMTAKVVPCQRALQGFLQWTLSVFKFSDAHGPFPRGELTFDATGAGGAAPDPSVARHRSCTGGNR